MRQAVRLDPAAVMRSAGEIEPVGAGGTGDSAGLIFHIEHPRKGSEDVFDADTPANSAAAACDQASRLEALWPEQSAVLL